MLTVSWRAPSATIDHYTVVLTGRSPPPRPRLPRRCAARRGARCARRRVGDQHGRHRPAVDRRDRGRRARPGAPVGLHARGGRRAKTIRVRAAWKAPDLGGGALVRYEVSGVGDRRNHQDDDRHLVPCRRRFPCAAPYTRRGAGGDQHCMPAGCSPNPSSDVERPARPGGVAPVRMRLDAADGDDAITVTAADDGGDLAVRAQLDGTVRWSGPAAVTRARIVPRRRPRPRNHLHRGPDRPQSRRNHDPDRPRVGHDRRSPTPRLPHVALSPPPAAPATSRHPGQARGRPAGHRRSVRRGPPAARGRPGTGKTSLARSLARSIGGRWSASSSPRTCCPATSPAS